MNNEPREPFALEPLPDDRPRRGAGALSAIGQGVVTGLLLIALGALLAVLAALGVYAYYARDLPMPDEMVQRSALFKSTKIMDRHGRVLYEVFDPYGGRRTLVRYEELPQVVIEATVATEDATFFTNPGFSPLAIARALYDDLRRGEIVSGASTITQQLVKNLFLTNETTVERKVKEAILAAEITRRYDKTEILAVYLNEVYFGNLAYGIGSAAETYFGKDVSALSLPEASLLIGLIQSPVAYDPYVAPDAAIGRRATVLRLMRERGYITRAEEEAAREAPLDLKPPTITMEAPHLVMHVREDLEARFGADVLYKGGLQVYTTLDLDLQRQAEDAIRTHLPALQERGASNAALVAIDPRTGDVLAMVGSADFWDSAISGQVNVATSQRQPGSTIKPLTYLAGMEQHGWGPATMLMDVETSFPDGANPPYRPVNNDGKFWGPMSLRAALGNSRNIPAVWALQQVGLPGLLEMAERLGIRSLTRPDYGLSLTLGGGEVTLLEMTGAYACLAAGGERAAPRTILRIEDQNDHVLQAEGELVRERVLDPRHAYLMTDMLADAEARVAAFGRDNVLALDFPAAVKTGTTNDYRDGWAVGYTPDLVVGVWVGNSDNTPTQRLSGVRGAGVIWRDVMERAQGNRPPVAFPRPEGIVEVEVCAVSGHPRTDLCPASRTELFLADAVPEGEMCPVHRRVRICTATGQVASAYCPEDAVTERVFEDYGPEWEEWARGRGLEIPPRQECPQHLPPTRVHIAAPGVAAGVIDVRGAADIPAFDHYVVEYGMGHDPQTWGSVTGRVTELVTEGLLARWDTRSVPDGEYTLRLLVTESQGAVHEARTTLRIANAVPAPTATQVPPTLAPPTATPTVPPSPTAEPSPTVGETPSLVPTATPPPPTPTTPPTEPPTATDTPEPTPEEGASPTPTEAATSPDAPPTEPPAAEPPPTPIVGPPPKVVD
jgi:1A family penicillin-binding protein